jgi:hypothetical protein
MQSSLVLFAHTLIPHSVSAGTDVQAHPLQLLPIMFVARLFALNITSATLAGVAARAITTKTTTITG